MVVRCIQTHLCTWLYLYGKLLQLLDQVSGNRKTGFGFRGFIPQMVHEWMFRVLGNLLSVDGLIYCLMYWTVMQMRPKHVSPNDFQ